MTPQLIILAIRSIFRLGIASQAAYEQRVRDRGLDVAALGIANISFSEAEEAAAYVDDQHRRWESDPARKAKIEKALHDQADDSNATPEEKASARRFLIEEASRLRLEEIAEGDDDAPGLEIDLAAYAVLQQWRQDDAQPPPPLVRIGLALTNVAVDVVNTRGSSFGLSEDMEALVGALVNNIAAKLPDPDKVDDWKAQVDLAERVASLMLAAGLKTIADNSDKLVGSEVAQDLVDGAVTPIWELVEKNPNRLPRMEQIAETFLGPVTSRTLTVLADRQSTILGAGLDPKDTGVGALMNAFIRTVADEGLEQTFTREGAAKVYDATLKIVVDRPDLFVRLDDAKKNEAVKDLLSSVTKAVAAHNPFRDKESGIGRDIAIAVIETVAGHSELLLTRKGDWNTVASDVVTQVLEGFATGLKSGSTFQGAFNDALSRGRLVELARIVVERVAQTPGMVTNKGEIQGLVAAVAKAMAADENLLLDDDGWRRIAAVAAEEAARNPGRLFGVDAAGNVTEDIGLKLLQTALTAAGAALGAGGDAAALRTSGALLFGTTLSEVMITTLRTAARNKTAAKEHVNALADLLAALNKAASAEPGRIGAREYVRLFEALSGPILDRGAVELLQLNDDVLAQARRAEVKPEDLTTERILSLLQSSDLSVAAGRPVEITGGTGQ